MRESSGLSKAESVSFAPDICEEGLSQPLTKGEQSPGSREGSSWPSEQSGTSRRVSFQQGFRETAGKKTAVNFLRASSAPDEDTGRKSSTAGVTSPGSFKRIGSEPGRRGVSVMKKKPDQVLDEETRRKTRLRNTIARDLLGYQELSTQSDEEQDTSDEDVDAQFSVVGETLTTSKSMTEAGRSCSFRACLKAIIESSWFQFLTFGTIIVNAAVIGFETDYPDMKCWVFVENTFLLVFTVELVLRLVVQGPRKFFCGAASKPPEEKEKPPPEKSKSNIRATLAAAKKEKEEATNDPYKSDIYTARRKPVSGDTEVALTLAWNFFDFTIVSIGLTNTFGSLVGFESVGGGDVTIFRAIRLLRVLRVLRVIRVLKFLKQLYLLAYGFVEGTMAVFWVAVLATCCCYLFAIGLVKGYGHPDDSDPHKEFFVVHFGTVPRTMFTLFEILASPSLGEYRDVISDHPPLAAFMLFFVVFGSFGITGLLTGVITESIIDKNQARIEEQRQEREAKRRTLEEQSGLLFDDMVEEKDEEDQFDDSGDLCLEVDDLVFHKEHISLLFQAAGVAFPDFEFDHMCAALDFDESGQISKQEFVHGILELCEDVRPMSIMELHSQVSKVKLKCISIMTDVQEVRTMLDPAYARSASVRASMRASMRKTSLKASQDQDPTASQQFSAKESSQSWSRPSLPEGSVGMSRDLPSQIQTNFERHEGILAELKQMIQNLTTEAEVLVSSARADADTQSKLTEASLTLPTKDDLKQSVVGGRDVSTDKLTDRGGPPEQQQSAGSVFAPGPRTLMLSQTESPQQASPSNSRPEASSGTAVPLLAPPPNTRPDAPSPMPASQSSGAATQQVAMAPLAPAIDGQGTEMSSGSMMNPRCNSY